MESNYSIKGVKREYFTYRALGSSSSGSGEFTGNRFLVLFFGEIGIGATARSQSGITGHELQSLGQGPFFSKFHFAESLNLNGMEWLELHGVGIFRTEFTKSGKEKALKG